MRLKNIKGAKEKINKSKYIIINPEHYKENFKSLFNNNNPIYIEIGMGKGNFIINNAINNPNINFIGIEMYDSVLVRAIEKLENYELSNLKIIRYDATYIENLFKNEIDLIYLNFSDPWPKNRHEFRRLSSERFLKRYDKIFRNKNQIMMKTDNRKLFEFSLISFTNYGYKIDNISLDLYKDNIKNNIQTEYEAKFVSQGFPIYKIEVHK